MTENPKIEFEDVLGGGSLLRRVEKQDKVENTASNSSSERPVKGQSVTVHLIGRTLINKQDELNVEENVCTQDEKEEIENLTSLQQQQNNLIYNLGQTEYQLEAFENRKKNIYQKLQDLEGEQTKSAQEIENKYGQGSVNLENGEFIKD